MALRTSLNTASLIVSDPSYNWLGSGGEMGKLIRSIDWTKTPLGPSDSWPQSLRTTVSLCLASNFPISLAWGPHHVQIYNDGYWPICGGKHPRSMGQDFTECWAAPWPVIGESFERALAGQTSFLEDQRMFLDRNGYLEETWFTFSFSPIRDETGGVGGLFHPVTETTSKMLSERRTRCLRDLAARAAKALSVEESCIIAAQTLGQCELDLPFVLFYLFDDVYKKARLVATSGLQPGNPACPQMIDLETNQRSGWALAATNSAAPQHISDLSTRFGPLFGGPYAEPLTAAMSLPIIPPGCAQAIGVLVAGVSSRSPLNESYRAFFDLLTTGVTAAIASARAYQEERKRAEALAEIDRAKTAFFSNVSHEFRTPLTLMLGPLEDELAEQAAPLPPARRERLDMAHRNSLRLLKLVNSLLDFSRIEAGRVQASYEATDLSSFTIELASSFRSAMERAGLSLHLHCPALPEPVYVDREMWEKIVLNLLSNAFKHTFEGAITITLRWRGEFIELELNDTGVGIPAEALPRLFERFHRVKGAKSRTYEGTGIGLALVLELVALHGGTIQVASEENRGSTFTVAIKTGIAHLPPDHVSTRVSSHAAARTDTFVEEALLWLPQLPVAQHTPLPISPQPTEPSQSAPRANRKRPRILWADDNADMRGYVSRLLADTYDVIPVPDGLTAYESAEADPPDLILTDVMMPGLDGFALLRKLREAPRTRTVPVILLSARAGEEASLEGLDAGADDYLVKPFSARELLARVRTHLQLAEVRKEWASELEKANRELKITNQELEAFSSSVSHDLRGHLMAIQGFTELLLAKSAHIPGEPSRKYLNSIDATVTRMSRLIEDLLVLSKVNRQDLRILDVNLRFLVDEVLDELQQFTANRTIELRIDKLPVVRCDPGLIKQVFTNLLSNAIKYTRPRHPAVIEVGQLSGNGMPVFSVRDNGVGFDSKNAAKLFTAFERFHRDQDFEGTGVGLATVQRIISRHGGSIWAESEVGKGATFLFTLGTSHN